jgi:hypothetical protein
MKKCLLYGNCQAEAMKFHFSKIESFNDKYEIQQIKPVHFLTSEDVPELLKKIEETDLLIHQPISDNYKGLKELGSNFLKSKMKNGSVALSFPSIYFKGYNPEMIGLKNFNKTNYQGPFSYYDGQLMYEVFTGDQDVNSLISKINDESYFCKEKVIKAFNDSLNTLKQREKGLDLTVSDIIEKHASKEKLFHVFNHPSLTIISELMKKIMIMINIDIEEIKGSDTLNRTTYPVYSSIYKHLGFNFNNPHQYKIDNNEYSAVDYIRRIIGFVEENKPIVKFNLELNNYI